MVTCTTVDGKILHWNKFQYSDNLLVTCTDYNTQWANPSGFQYSDKLLVTCTVKSKALTNYNRFSIQINYWSLVRLTGQALAVHNLFQYSDKLLVTCTDDLDIYKLQDTFQYSDKLLVTLVSFCHSPRRKINLRFTHYFDFNVKIAKALLALSI